MEVCLLLGMAQPGRLGRKWKLEIGNWKLGTRSWKLEIGHGLEFRVSSFQFQVSLFPNPNATVTENGRKKKNLRTNPPSY
jgi:hypothetical protein